MILWLDFSGRLFFPAGEESSGSMAERRRQRNSPSSTFSTGSISFAPGQGGQTHSARQKRLRRGDRLYKKPIAAETGGDLLIEIYYILPHHPAPFYARKERETVKNIRKKLTAACHAQSFTRREWRYSFLPALMRRLSTAFWMLFLCTQTGRRRCSIYSTALSHCFARAVAKYQAIIMFT